MTRPSHLVCLAILRSAIEEDGALAGNVATLRARGWLVADIVDGETKWHS